MISLNKYMAEKLSQRQSGIEKRARMSESISRQSGIKKRARISKSINRQNANALKKHSIQRKTDHKLKYF